MTTSPDRHDALLTALRSAAGELGAYLDAAEHEPVPDQCYRLLTAIGALVVSYRLRVTPDTRLTMRHQRQIISDTFHAVNSHEQFLLTAALDLLNQAMALCLTAPSSKDDAPHRLAGSLLAAASNLLITEVIDLKDGVTVTSGREEIALPGYRAMLLECRTAADRALAYVNDILDQPHPPTP